MPETFKNIIPELTLNQILGYEKIDKEGENIYTESMPTENTTQGNTLLTPRVIGGVLEGASFRSADSGSRLEIYPEWDPTIGMVAYESDGSTEIFKMIVDGTNVGDVILGDYDGGAGCKWDASADTFDVLGSVTATSGSIGGWNILSGYIYNLQSGTPTSSPSDGIVMASGNEGIIVYENTEKRVELGYLSAGVYGLKVYADDGSTVIFEASDTQKIFTSGMLGTGSEISIQGWQHDMAFSATDNDTVAWASGTITLMNGDTYSITGANTGTMSAITYIYLDVGTSSTVLQTTTTASTAVGSGKILIAVAQNVTSGKKAIFQVFGGKALGGYGKLVTADDIVANTITTNEVLANTFLGTEFSASAKITAGTGNNVGVLDGADGTYRIYAGHATPASAPFRVSQAGALVSTSATITGIINATSGYFGNVTNGITVDATGLTIAGTGHIRTASSGARIELVTGSEGLVSYDGSNRERLSISEADIVFTNIDGSTAGSIATSGLSDDNITFGCDGILTFDTKDIRIGDLTEAGKGYIHIKGDDDSDDDPGCIVMYEHDGTPQYLWVDQNGKLRIHTSAPTDEDSDGSVMAFTSQLGIQNVACGVGVDPGSNGTQNISIGFTPKVIIFSATCNISSATEGPFVSSGVAIGAGVQNGTNYCIASSQGDDDGNYGYSNDTYCIYTQNKGVAKTYAYVSTFGSTTTLTWVCDGSYQVPYSWIALA